VLVLAVEGAIRWGYGLSLALGGLLGGYLGGMLSGRVNRTALRAVVIAIGFGVGAYYFWNLYGPAGFRIGGEGLYEYTPTTAQNAPSTHSST
jgi:hypothetical protein